MRMSKLFRYLFFAVTIAHICVVAFGLSGAHYVTKPLILLSLIGYYLSTVIDRSNLLLLALVFSLGGDVALMFQSVNENFFLIGLASFLIAHILYILVYRQFRNEDATDELVGIQKIRLSMPIILAGTGLVVVLYPHLGAFKVPVLIYAGTIITMVMNALFRAGRTNKLSFVLVLVGAILFMISDSILAINRFMMPVTYSEFLIMSTYAGAQYLIVQGLIRHQQ